VELKLQWRESKSCARIGREKDVEFGRVRWVPKWEFVREWEERFFAGAKRGRVLQYCKGVLGVGEKTKQRGRRGND